MTRKITFTPSVGASADWQSWQDAGAGVDRRDLYQGRAFTGANLRQRVTRRLDYDLTHTYRVRMAPNRLKRDHAGAPDRGIEANSLGLFLSYRRGGLLWVRANSGYDLRTVDGRPIRSVREKIAPPTVEVSLAPVRRLSFFYRQSQLLFPARRPETGQFSMTMGRRDRTHFLSGWSYNVGTPHQLQVRHGASFFLTRGWWLDGGVQYNAKGPRRTRYNSVQVIEKYLILKRSLHCWQVRVETRERLDTKEIFFRVDLKTDLEVRRALAAEDEEQFYPARELESVIP